MKRSPAGSDEERDGVDVSEPACTVSLADDDFRTANRLNLLAFDWNSSRHIGRGQIAFECLEAKVR